MYPNTINYPLFLFIPAMHLFLENKLLHSEHQMEQARTLRSNENPYDLNRVEKIS